jgi:hypothetical protein
MVRTLRLLAFGTAFLALTGVGAHALSLWAGRAGAWELARALLTEARRGEALDARDATCRRYNEAKQAVTNEVIAGRLSLTEAAERFGQLADLFAGYEGTVAAYKAPVGEQDLCGNVIIWVAASRADAAGRQARVRARLEAEYRERFGAEPPRPGWATGSGPLAAEVRAPARGHRRRGR